MGFLLLLLKFLDIPLMSGLTRQAEQNLTSNATDFGLACWVEYLKGFSAILASSLLDCFHA